MDSFFDEIEPRVNRPVVPAYQDHRGGLNLQVSEPSLMNVQELTKENYGVNWMHGLKHDSLETGRGRQVDQEQKCARYILKDLKDHNCNHQQMVTQNHNCQSNDVELKKMIESQNMQLQMLHKQVEKLLEYQEKLHNKSKNERPVVNESSTQTSLVTRDPGSSSPGEAKFLQPSESLINQQTMSDKSELTLGFQDLRLETIVEQPPSPPCSVVVNMQEYPESISEQFYLTDNDNSHDIMEQVQKLLARANGSSNNDLILPRSTNQQTFKGIATSHELETSLKKITIKQVHDVGISFNTTSLNRLLFVNSSKSNSWDVTQKETDRSIEMQQLARKYLGRLELTEEKSVCLRNSVEMSMSSQQYLAKYGLLPNQTKSNWE